MNVPHTNTRRLMVAAAIVLVAVGCSRAPEPTPVRITGDRTEAVPTTAVTTTTTTIPPTSTTLYYGPDGPGADAGEETTTTKAPAPSTTTLSPTSVPAPTTTVPAE